MKYALKWLTTSEKQLLETSLNNAIHRFTYTGLLQLSLERSVSRLKDVVFELSQKHKKSPHREYTLRKWIWKRFCYGARKLGTPDMILALEMYEAEHEGYL